LIDSFIRLYCTVPLAVVTAVVNTKKKGNNKAY
jgi:hypothetical protein